MIARMRCRKKEKKKKGGGGGRENNFDSLMVPGNNVTFTYDLNSRSEFVTGLTDKGPG